jgi:hypothetical protein
MSEFNYGQRRRRFPWTLFILMLGPALLIVVFGRGCTSKYQELDIFGQVGNFTFHFEDGTPFNRDSLKGKITIFTTYQVACPDSCGIDLWFMREQLYKKIYNNRKKLPHVQIISILTDVQGNPINFEEGADFGIRDIVTKGLKKEEYNKSIWRLVSGDPKQIYNITHNGINLYEEVKEGFLSNRPFLECLMLVDEQGRLRFVRYGRSEGMVRDFHEGFMLLQKEFERKRREGNISGNN